MLKTDEGGGLIVRGSSIPTPYAFPTWPISRARENSRNEFSSRRPSFRSGSPIQLSDGQTWIIPSPPTELERSSTPFKTAYVDIIKAIMEAEDSSEQRLGELAFAIFLLDQNYHLSPADYQRLLAPGTGDWQFAFHQIAQNHLYEFMDLYRGQLQN